MDTKGKIFDAILVAAGVIQTAISDMSFNIWQELIQNPIPTIIGILTIILIIIRIKLGIKDIRKSDD